MSEHGRFHPGPAHLVDRRCARTIGQTGPTGRLASRGLPLTSRQHAAHQDLVHSLAREPGPVEGSPDNVAAKSRSAESGEAALEPPQRASHSGNNDNGIG
ncbi:hypothetical protein MAE02_06270 [Microvirga aerophila]|uniref:Uncharacterized protein n=1 Tax=Microvirga aerophila TaxID=670291 RepID=A0A512BLT4_9HYPH|nr:hypothetical protein MAE02_06270 [Microvirga aerophila]